MRSSCQPCRKPVHHQPRLLLGAFHLAEFGRVYPNSAAAALAGARAALTDDALPPAPRRGVARQIEHLRELDQRIGECDREIAQDAAAKKCGAVPMPSISP